MHLDRLGSGSGLVASLLVLFVVGGCDGGEGDAQQTSTDASRVTVSRTAHLAVIRSDGTGLKVLGPASNLAASPAPSWSPRGNEIAFAYQRCSACHPRLSILNEKGRLRPLDGAVGGDPGWSPDDRRIAYTHKGETDRELMVRNFATGSDRELTTAENASHPAWFPAGDTIVFAAEVNERLQLFRVGPDGANERQLTTSGFYDDPSVSPDGRRLVFACQSPSVTWDLCISNVRGGRIRPILRWPSNERNPVFSPSGNSLVFSSDRGSRAGERALYVLDLRRRLVTRLTGETIDAGEPDWSPDGQRIVFTLRRLVPVVGG